MTTDNVDNEISAIHILEVLLKMSAADNGKKPEIKMSKTDLFTILTSE